MRRTRPGEAAVIVRCVIRISQQVLTVDFAYFDDLHQMSRTIGIRLTREHRSLQHQADGMGTLALTHQHFASTEGQTPDAETGGDTADLFVCETGKDDRGHDVGIEYLALRVRKGHRRAFHRMLPRQPTATRDVATIAIE